MKTYYDIHCHIFNKDVIIRKLVNVVQSLLTIKDMIDGPISEAEFEYQLNGINKTLHNVTKDTSEDVFKVLNSVYQGKIITTPLMFDLTYADDNDDEDHDNRRYRRRIKLTFWLMSSVIIPYIRRKARHKFKNDKLTKAIDAMRDKVKEFNKSFEKKSDEEVEIFDNANFGQQIEDLEYIAGKYKTVRPFFSVDPRREYKGKINTIKNLKEKLLSANAKFAGIKLYAPAGFSPTDPVLMGTPKQKGVYQFCIENKIPITAHNSNAGFACLSTILNVKGHVKSKNAIVNINGPIKFDNLFFSKYANEAIAERADTLNHPKLWEIVLKKYPDLTINFAHFGGSSQILEYVNYEINKKSIDVDIFENEIQFLSKTDREIISSAFRKKRSKMLLRDNFTITERAEIWNAMYRAGFINNWTKAIFDLIKNPNYPNVYTDLSCFSSGTLLRSAETNELTFTIKKELRTFKINFFDKLTTYEKSKILYGSDYFLAQFFGPTIERYFADFKEVFGSDFDIIASDNPKRFLND